MRRFEYDDSDDFFRDDLENFFDEEEHEHFSVPKGELINVLQLDLVEADLNMKLLSLSVRTLEKTFLWKFRSPKTKIKMISEMYKEMVKLIDRDLKETGDAAV